MLVFEPSSFEPEEFFKGSGQDAMVWDGTVLEDATRFEDYIRSDKSSIDFLLLWITFRCL